MMIDDFWWFFEDSLKSFDDWWWLMTIDDSWFMIFDAFLAGSSKYCLFSPGEMMQFDKHIFSGGLKLNYQLVFDKTLVK